ncbi:GlsB/YeaQ/YmgE family stress response membrane protein [Sphingosinicella sp. CPCC 101087]|uniref:GlsB/YeaQ/YmgE family stress response membrane protein n=1 Tax=Sphingosinicella sp. CPCC 101087 TaxID=2497754 RepID=UPI00101BC6D5|nr:GlsB/YeaQ/YmgE family stress response membrane protein [Sphingosinicella sp. CPCC 101087]
MGIIIILIVGALVGWVAGMIMRTGGGILFDIVIGIVGALIAGFLFGGGASILNAPLNLTSILYSLIGAIILLALYKLVMRGRV